MNNNNKIDFPYKKDFLYKNHNNFLSVLRKYKPIIIKQNKINKLDLKFKKSPFENLAKDKLELLYKKLLVNLQNKLNFYK